MNNNEKESLTPIIIGATLGIIALLLLATLAAVCLTIDIYSFIWIIKDGTGAGQAAHWCVDVSVTSSLFVTIWVILKSIINFIRNIKKLIKEE